ncbi:MAG: hypothetical protein ABF713_07135 [Acetobacter orientalis]|uniref:hypothetical protein n=1 Tax=Acetobacter orientalis TaxID=146474 RepID=UPI0039E9BDE7
MTNNTNAKGRFVSFCSKHCPFLLDSTMPVWLTILLSIVAGFTASVGTYFLAPEINAKYQENQTKETHIAESTKSLNDEIIILSQKIRKLIEVLEDDKRSSKEIVKVKGDCLDSITKMQWQIVELSVLITRKEGVDYIKNLSSSIEELREEIIFSKGPSDEEKIIQKMKKIEQNVKGVLNQLYILAKLRD